MNAVIDQICFGNPSKEDVTAMKVENYLDKLIPDLKNFQPAPNSSQATIDELQMLVQYADMPEPHGRKTIFDQSLVPYINDLFARNGADIEQVQQTTQQLVDDVLPIITKLKYFFNRPRPFQLAFYHQIPLYWGYSYFVSSPSYPSGHSTLGLVICEVLGNHYPNSYGAMQNFMEEVAHSRLHLGAHYPSDNNFARIVAQRIFNNTEFRTKYKL